MATNTLTREAPYKEKQPRKISIEAFLRRYRKGKPGIKYEFNNGIIEKSDAMRFSEQYITLNMLNHFDKTLPAGNGCKIVNELEVWTSENQFRKPDLSFITPEEIYAATQGNEPVPEFLIEVISKNDKINQVKNKVYEYFNSGVKVLWHIFPELKVVEVYHSPEKYETFSGDKICSAEPVVEGFNMKAQDIFKINKPSS